MRWRPRIAAFFFANETDAWLAFLRVGLGVEVIAYCISLQDSWSSLLAKSGGGLIGREVSEAFTRLQSPFIPRLGWFIDAAQHLGLREETTLSLLWLALLFAGLLLLTGLCSRAASVTCWLLHLCVSKSGGLVSYGLDNFMTIGLFYLMLAPLPDRWTLDRWIWKNRGRSADLLGFFRRVLQLHLCIIYFFGGLTKALGSGWWNGENLWRALTRAPFDVLPLDVVVSWKALLPALGISVWLIELCYPVLIWPRQTRLLWLGLICLMHFGIGFAMGMPLFAVVMIVMNVAAFGPAQGVPRQSVAEGADAVPA